MLAKVFSAAVVGLDAVPVEVEVDIASQGFPSFTIVGLPDKAVEEAKERVRSAIRNSGADFPARRITVNLAPADLPKEGPSYDLPIALGVLVASRQLQSDLSKTLVSGELSLDGRVRSINGALIQTLMARDKKFTKVFIPAENAAESAIVEDVSIYHIESLKSLFFHLTDRQPIEDTIVSISRAKGKTTFPTKCMLIASQNPCPCGYLGDKTHRCICTPSQISRYKKKISGPLLDRIDIHLDIPAVKIEKLTENETNNVENSHTVQTRVQKARDKQNARYKGTSITFNAELTNKSIKIYCQLSDERIDLLRLAVTKMGRSGRAYYRIIKLSRTIADLEDTETIQPQHIEEALQYRPKGEEY
jgi:predicted ATPase with chaperone activity